LGFSVGARKVEIVPTVIDLARYSLLSCERRKTIVIGWIGSPSTAPYLHIVVPALKVLSEEFSLQLRIIGAQIELPGLEVDCRPWSEESEVGEIQHFDIGIMPLIDSPWEQGKCGYKLIQYMACGKPVIASPVGMNSEIVEQGVNGYLANNFNEWVLALRKLCVDKKMAKEMGMRGRLRVEQKYCLQVTTPRMAQIFHDAFSREGA